jgi:hypothetical protein
VDVLGHEDVSHDGEPVLAADLLEDAKEQVARRPVPRSGRRR